MDQSLFTLYVPAINAFLNPRVDATCKSWDDLVTWFFKMNNDKRLSSVSDIAESFINSINPNFFKIDVEGIQPHFLKYKITEKNLNKSNFVKNEHYIIDDEGIRITFTAMRRLIISHGDLILIRSFEFIDKTFQMYLRYLNAIGAKARRHTHWTMIERVDEFTKTMRPHEDSIEGSKKFHIMDVQPRVFCIIKGSWKTVNSLLTKALKDSKKRYSQERKFPIYETVMPTADDEINIILGNLEACHILPYREKQLGTQDANGKEIVKLTKTKHNLRLYKKCIMVDPSQDAFKVDDLSTYINDIRTKIKLGRTIAGSEQPKKKSCLGICEDNFIDIKIFEKTKGCYIDDLQSLILNPRNDDVTLVDNQDINRYSTDIEEIDVDAQNDMKSVASAMTDMTVDARARTNSSSSTASTLPCTTEEEYSDTDEDETAKKKRGRTNSTMEIKKSNATPVNTTILEEDEGYE